MNFRIIENPDETTLYDKFIQEYNRGTTIENIKKKLKIGSSRYIKLLNQATSQGDITPRKKSIIRNNGEYFVYNPNGRKRIRCKTLKEAQEVEKNIHQAYKNRKKKFKHWHKVYNTYVASKTIKKTRYFWYFKTQEYCEKYVEYMKDHDWEMTPETEEYYLLLKKQEKELHEPVPVVTI